MELKDRILLAIPNDCSMQPHKLEGGASEANINAIRQLRMEGLITAVGDSDGGFIKFELTDRGKLRKAKLVELQNRKWWQKSIDCSKRIINSSLLASSLKWVLGIAATVIGGWILGVLTK